MKIEKSTDKAPAPIRVGLIGVGGHARQILIPAMQRLTVRLALSVFFVCLHSICASGADTAGQQSLREYKARMPLARVQINNIVASAEASAARMQQNPAALINVPYWEQPSFAEELLNRAGGLALALPTVERAEDATDQDIVLLSVRSWEEDADKTAKLIKDYRDKKWLTVLFASAAGCPAAVKADFLVDNGASGPGKEHGRINVLSNVTLGWMWCCEYVAAMTRHGKIPGVLMSIMLPGSDAHNAEIQTPAGRHFLGECQIAIPAGELADKYLLRLETLIADLEGAPIQKQITAAADIVAARMNQGGTVGLAGVGHLILFEAELDNKVPWKGFSGMEVQGGKISTKLKAGDLITWIGYAGGLNSLYFDFAKALHGAKLDVISCYAPIPGEPPLLNAVKPLAHIDQSWKVGDAEIEIPASPGRMAPISGLNAILIQRMLDDEVADRITKKDIVTLLRTAASAPKLPER